MAESDPLAQKDDQAPRLILAGMEGECWMAFAYRTGYLRLITPEVIPFCKSQDEAIGRIYDRFGQDERLHQRFKGCFVFVCRLDNGVSIDKLAERHQKQKLILPT